MLSRLFWAFFYTSIGLLLIAFMALNRDSVSLQLIPFTARLQMPLFAALSIVFVLGLIIGLSWGAVQSLTHGKRQRQHHRAMAQLEKELARKPGHD
jgi:uncharacterized integral membrane protein